MRLILQRVTRAEVRVDGISTGKIGIGLVVLLGFGQEDSPELIPGAVKKINELRIFSDANGKMNLSLKDIEGSVLAISQFTLYANCARGRRPDFTHAAPPILAEELYNLFLNGLKDAGIPYQTGIFGADMKLELLNDGPVTISLEF
jgi:D-tyrosyl-tRNA(Tyr) deacylase